MRGMFQAALEKKINEHIQNQALSLAGGAAHSYDEYRFWVGYMQGLRVALDLCTEVEQEADGERSNST